MPGYVISAVSAPIVATAGKPEGREEKLEQMRVVTGRAGKRLAQVR